MNNIISNKNEIIIPDANEWNTAQLINNTFVFRRRSTILTEQELFAKDLNGSSVSSFKLNESIIHKNKYSPCLKAVYSWMDRQDILNHTTLNISTEAIHEKGFKYCKKLNLSIQGVDARRCLKEIINMVNVNKYRMEMIIKLKNGESVTFQM